MLFGIPTHTYRSDRAKIALARSFASSVVKTVNYSDSRQVNRRKIEADHFISKLGEEAVYAVFSGFFHLTKPDYTIYQGKQKSWDADFMLNGIDLAVKTQTTSSALRYGLSWMFQWGRVRRDRVLNNPEAWVCFVECDDRSPNYICKVYPPLQVKDIVFGEPKLARLKGEKKVVYAHQQQIFAA